MKFGENLHLHIYKPWHKYYVPYHRLKRMLSRYEEIRKRYMEECAEGKYRRQAQYKANDFAAH